MSRRIAFFDFDGTITTKDTFLEILKHRFGAPKFYLGFLINSPFIVAWKLGVISNQRAKESVMRFFFGKQPVATFNESCQAFAREAMPALVRKKALKEIQQLQKAGAKVVIVSASPENWLQPWCEELKTDLLATRLETRQERITGKIAGLNCHGEEKVRRIREVYNLADYDEVYCYGDTKGDKPMLSLATFAFYQPFR